MFLGPSAAPPPSPLTHRLHPNDPINETLQGPFRPRPLCADSVIDLGRKQTVIVPPETEQDYMFCFCLSVEPGADDGNNNENNDDNKKKKNSHSLMGS